MMENRVERESGRGGGEKLRRGEIRKGVEKFTGVEKRREEWDGENCKGRAREK